MKKALIVLFLMVSFHGCQGQSLRMIWEAPVVYDSLEVDHFILYIFQGDSTPLPNMRTDYVRYIPTQDSLYKLGFDSLITVDYDSGYYNYQHRHFFDPKKIIAGGVQAEDIRGRRSGITISDFYDKPVNLNQKPGVNK